MKQSQDNLIALMGADNDPFVKWDASQRLAYAAIDRGAKALARLRRRIEAGTVQRHRGRDEGAVAQPAYRGVAGR